MEKPNYVASERVTCIACGLPGAVAFVTLVSFPCFPLYVAVAV
ncbi:MAG: hypothetical protein DDT32_01128 [Syntrophomonadaceae bacterium]|nr:hypothetical protein [Bacillota bacterium]